MTIIRGMMAAPETFRYQGRRFGVEAATLEPKPVNGTIPIYLGAIGPRMLRYTGRDPATLRRVINGLGYVGSRDPQEVTANIRPGRSRGLLGTPAEILAQIEEYREQGIDTFRLQFANEGLEEQLQQFGEEMIARFSK
jgi:alkanesulfonate monooxygenase SsuD/methylene tetrahydromethanopterin reductase-like flavin-dependent oxidoreductase (luciferase family)